MTLTTTPTLDEARAAAQEAQAALDAAQAIADREAEERAAQAHVARVERSQRVIDARPAVEAAMAERISQANANRDAALAALDLGAILTTESGVHTAVAASNIWRERYNAALNLLWQEGIVDRRVGPSELPPRRERRISLFGTGGDDGTIGSAIRRRAMAASDDLLAEVLADLDLSDLLPEA